MLTHCAHVDTTCTACTGYAGASLPNLKILCISAEDTCVSLKISHVSYEDIVCTSYEDIVCILYEDTCDICGDECVSWNHHPLISAFWDEEKMEYVHVAVEAIITRPWWRMTRVQRVYWLMGGCRPRIHRASSLWRPRMGHVRHVRAGDACATASW